MPNFGVMLWATNEDTDYNTLWFRSSEYSNSTYWPKLEVTYSTDAATKTVYFLKDHLGSVRATVLDSAGAPVIGYDDYDPWGYPLATRTKAIPNAYLQGASKIKFTSKEYDDEFGVNWYDSPFRDYDPQIGRWMSADPLAVKYPSFSPYNYAANNPILFLDINGDSLWIYGDKGEKILYTAGMKYTGKNASVAKVVKSLNSTSSFTSGYKVLSALIGSEGNYNVMLNQNVDPNTGGNFVGNKDGPGGNINIGKGNESVFTVSHESFHAYQHEMGVGGGSLKSETEAYLFSYALGTASGERLPLRYQSFTSGGAWRNEFLQMVKSFYEPNFWNNLVYGFKNSPFNEHGIYNKFPEGTDQRVIISAMYPLTTRRKR